MSLYVIDVLLAAVGIVTLWFATWVQRTLRARYMGRVSSLTQNQRQEERYADLGYSMKVGSHALGAPSAEEAGRQREKFAASYNVSKARRATAARIRRATLFLIVANVVTTILALLPFVAAVVTLIDNRPQVALQFNVLGFITLVVTKVGLFILTALAIPFLKGAAEEAGRIVVRRRFGKEHRAKSSE